VTDESHLIRLERDLGRLEGIVGQLVRGISQDRLNSEEQRKALYAYIEASNTRSEKLIEGLAQQIKALADNDKAVMQSAASTKGQWALSRYLLVTAISMVAIISGYLGGMRAAMRHAGAVPHTPSAPHSGGVITNPGR